MDRSEPALGTFSIASIIERLRYWEAMAMQHLRDGVVARNRLSATMIAIIFTIGGIATTLGPPAMYLATMWLLCAATVFARIAWLHHGELRRRATRVPHARARHS